MTFNNEFEKYAVKHHGISSLTLHNYKSLMSGVQGMTRSIIEERAQPFREIDVFSRLMADRIIFMGTPIDDYIANVVQAQMLFLESADSKRDIQMYINSPGGSVHAGLGIYDTMQYINPDVATICTGMAASMGAVLMCAGVKGKRTALKHARIMIHQPMGGMQGQASDMEISFKQISLLRQELYEIISKHSGKTYEQVHKDSDRDYWMTAAEAKEYGMVDEILLKSKNDKKNN
jgi:ATP-dependent Clp protease protease subunit